MKKIVIQGGERLCGEVRIGGSKNAALPILFAGVLSRDVCVFRNLPRVGDVLRTLEILKSMGARIRFYTSGEVEVGYRDVRSCLVSPQLTGALRGSTYLLGSMLARFGEASLCAFGGCDFCARPIDLHLDGFRALGATVAASDAAVLLRAEAGLRAARICLKKPSVGATANLLMAACGASGTTVLQNTANEPHVGALIAFLRQMGACIAQTEEALTVQGDAPLRGCEFEIIPDMIEAGTYLAFVLACGGRVTLTRIGAVDLAPIQEPLARMGVSLRAGENWVGLESDGIFRNTEITAGPYPAFPTDLQPQFCALAAGGGQGTASIKDTVFPTRFGYVRELAKMGARITLRGNTATTIPQRLHGARVRATDLRAGAALILAGLGAQGETVIENAAPIARGYEHPARKLSALGARIRAE